MTDKTNIEVEIKAHVDKWDSTLNNLKSNYEFIKEYFKDDLYLSGIDGITGENRDVRIRRVGNKNIVTYKERELHGNIEVNVEKEFTLDDADNFLYIIDKMGWRESRRKKKEGYHFQSGPVTLELSHVHKLGDFIEIEYVVEYEKEVESAKEEILQILDNIGISRDRIEHKTYSEMLAAL